MRDLRSKLAAAIGYLRGEVKVVPAGVFHGDMLKPEGWLYVGHSESLLNVTDRFDLVGRTIYRRTK